MDGRHSSSPSPASAEWLIGGGELGELIRNTDWAPTAFGPRTRWPQSLQTIVNLVVGSSFPMALLWGPDLLFLYNDGYRVILADKHPLALGRSTRDVWPEVWPINEPIFSAVMERGEAPFLEDKRFTIQRRGRLEEAYFTLSYSPVRLEDGSVGGTLVTLQETTSAVDRLSERDARLRDNEERLRRAQDLLGGLLDSTTETVAAVDHGFRYLAFNEAYRRDFRTIYGVELGTGDSVRELLAHLPTDLEHALEFFGRGLRGETALVLEAFGDPGLERRHYELTVSPVRGADGRIIGAAQVGRDVTERRRAEEAAARDLDAMTRLQSLGTLFAPEGALQPILDEIVNAAIAIAGADCGHLQLLDRATGELRIAAHRGLPEWWLDIWDRVARGTGVCGTALERGERIVVHDVETSPLFAGKPDLDIQLRAGVRAVQSTPLVSRSGRPVGMLSTHHRRPHRPDDRVLRLLDLLARQAADIIERAWTEEALNESNRRNREILDSIQDDFYVLDRDWRFVFASQNFTSRNGRTPPDVVGRSIWELFPQYLGTIFEENVRAAMERRELREFELRGPSIDVWYRMKVYPSVEGVTLLGVDITERKRAEAVSWESERRERQRAADLQTILDTAPIGLSIATDLSGHHILGNRANEEMFGLPPGAELSKAGPRAAGFRTFQDGRELAAVELPMQRAIRGEVVRDQVIDVVREDGQEFCLFAKASPLLDDAGQPRGAVGAFLDITALKRAERALREANAALADADRRKDEFIAVLSHELRNPLAPIRYALPQLAGEDLGAAGRRAAEVIDRQVALMSRLVDDLLDVSRITAGKIELRLAHVDLAAVVTAAVEGASPAITSGRHRLDVSVPDVPVWLHADAARVSQALTNLLNNSARYTPPEGLIRLVATADRANATIRVIDSGIGLPPEALKTVFEMFGQVSGRNSPQGGLGVGLTLARQIVEMHGGSIEACSAGHGQGAEFIVRLPLAGVAPAASDDAPSELGQPLPGLRVLLVDDNADLVEMLAIVVEAAGHDVRKAFDGRCAVSVALEYRPHVILLDVGMPGMSGIEVAQELRRHAEMAGSRIVALTGWGQAEDRRRTAEAGFDEHLTKPADPGHILQILERAAGAVGGE